MQHPLVAAASTGGLAATLAAAGWLGAFAILTSALLVVGTIGWIVNDDRRADRCALLIISWRRSPED